jgi:hypothetical protein
MFRFWELEMNSANLVYAKKLLKTVRPELGRLSNELFSEFRKLDLTAVGSFKLDEISQPLIAHLHAEGYVPVAGEFYVEWNALEEHGVICLRFLPDDGTLCSEYAHWIQIDCDGNCVFFWEE